MKTRATLAGLVAVVGLGTPPTVLGQAPRATAGPASAPITGVTYTVGFDRQLAARRVIAVSMTFAVGGDATAVLSFPAWTPGAYEVSNFARYVLGFEAMRDEQPLTWDKVDHDTWRVRAGSPGIVQVRYVVVADTLDNAMAWTRPDFALLNGTAAFMYPEGQPLTFPSRVTVRTDSSWRVATGMEQVAASRGVTTFTAPSYHDLVDMPFFIGRFDLDSAQVAGTWVRFASYPAGSVSGARRAEVWGQLRRMIPPQVAVFGEPAWRTYTVMQIADSSYGGASGLEHQNSHVDIVAPAAIGSDFLPSLYAHEIFHAWNVKRLRPAEMWPYAYDRAQPTTLLWVSEGITDYYADLSLVRGGIIDEAGFYATTAGKINEVANVAPVALEDASLSTWIHPVDGTGYVYYPKGSLAGFMLDILIRDASGNRRSLDDVMRALYDSTYRAGRGFTSEDFWGAVSQAAGGRSFAGFAAAYVDGRAPFPWDSILPRAGLRGIREMLPRLGVTTLPDEEGVRVTDVEPGGPAQAAGVRAGDYLVAIGGIPVDDPSFSDRFRARFAGAREGSAIAIRVRRGTAMLSLNGVVRLAPGEIRIERDPGASAEAVAVREGILRGTVRR